MRRLFTILFLWLFFAGKLFAQDTSQVWSLERCVDYAISHNISIQQDSLSARLAHYTVRQSVLSQLPSLNVSGSYGKSFGRSINPTTNQFVEGSYNFLSASANVNLTLFSGLQVRNTVARNRFSLAASLAEHEQLKDDVSLNVANGFLAALLAKEQINISNNQVSLTKAQLSQTRAFADAGRVPELNVAQLESQLASDSANLINAISSYNASILDLKALLNLDFETPFNILVSQISAGEQLAATALTPDDVYRKALTYFGSVKGAHFRVAAAEKGLAVAKGALYPQLSAQYQGGTNFSSNAQNYSYIVGADQPTGAYAVDALNNKYIVYQPGFTAVGTPILFSNQFDNNLRHTVALSLNLPVFNGWQSRYGTEQARITLQTQILTEYSTQLTLKQNVYKAHNNALNSVQKYQAAKRAEQAATRALEFAKKRYDLGLSSTVDLLVTQNAQYTAAANLVIAKYDLIFKLKVIDYYLGKELKL